MRFIGFTLASSVLVGAGVLSSAASALPVDSSVPTGLHRDMQEARLVCDVFGRCVRRGPPLVRVFPRVRLIPRVRVLPAVRFRPRIGLERGPEIGLRGGGFGVDRRREFDRYDRGNGGTLGDRGNQMQMRHYNGDNGHARMQGGDRAQGGRADQMQMRHYNGDNGQARMQGGDRGQGGQRAQRRLMPQGGQGGQRGGGGQGGNYQ